MAVKHLSPDELNKRRVRAVELRLAGQTLTQVAQQTGLSTPTVIAAFKAFKAGGWEAVKVARRGRKPGEGRALTAVQEQQLIDEMWAGSSVWSIEMLCTRAGELGTELSERSAQRLLERAQLLPPALVSEVPKRRRTQLARWFDGEFALLQQWLGSVTPDALPIWMGCRALPGLGYQLYWQTPRGELYWQLAVTPFTAEQLVALFGALQHRAGAAIGIVLQGLAALNVPAVALWLEQQAARCRVIQLPADADRDRAPTRAHRGQSIQPNQTDTSRKKMALTHLQRLEAESIHIMREVVAEAENPVMLYSIGKDSAVMLHLAMKAFAPSVPPFPLLHVDTRWKFREMYAFRDRMAKELGMDLLVHINPEAIEKDINPFTHGSAIHTDITKTEGLKQALDKYGFDAAFGGARRDEEKSRAKERIFSFRSAQHRWDPKSQRPELWKLYNARKHKGESIRVFPLSNWTELDIWQYIYLENIPLVPLYYAAERPVVERDGALIMVDDERMPLKPGEVPMMRKVRFRTLGCYPLTGAVESEADTLPAIIQEMLLTKTSERQGRVIDHDSSASMEKKKQEGYF